MKCRLASVFFVATTASGAVLKSTFLSKTAAQSEVLSAQSQNLDQVLQKYADELEKGDTHDFLRTLRLCAPCNTYERIGEPHDGGYVMCTDGLDKGLVGAYSYGINGFDGWGMEIAKRYKIPLNEYDCTNFNEPAVCSGCDVHFHGECILNQNGDKLKPFYKTLTQQLKESGNANAAERSLLLKIDVEAAEWDIFAQEPVENMKKFREIVVEYHWLNKQDQHPLYLAAVKKIEEAGFAVSHLHGNNYGGGNVHFDGYRIPNVLEVTYIQKPAQGCAANIPYHIPNLDTPNNAAAYEIPDARLPTML